MCERQVLVVEDDEPIRESLGDVLEEEGFSVATASNGAEALQRLRTKPHPCVILLDLMTPVMSGWELRRELLQDARLARIPVVLVSAVEDLRRQGKQLKAADVIGKPIPLERLLSCIEHHC